jgi:hypothetical protein
MPTPYSAATAAFEEAKRDRLLKILRVERDAAAARGDHAEALILNDRIADLKNGGSVVVERVMQEFEGKLKARRALEEK